MDCSYETSYKTYLWYLGLTGQPEKPFEEYMRLRDKVQKADKAKEFLNSGSEEPFGSEVSGLSK
jgi:hypothetical protein